VDTNNGSSTSIAATNKKTALRAKSFKGGLYCLVACVSLFYLGGNGIFGIVSSIEVAVICCVEFSTSFGAAAICRVFVDEVIVVFSFVAGVVVFFTVVKNFANGGVKVISDS
jgi:hypothetical protein